MGRFWKIVERLALLVGTICALVTTYYTVGLFYGWNEEKLSSVKSQAAAMIIPWWLYGLGTIALAVILTGWAMMALRLKRPSPQKEQFIKSPVANKITPTRASLPPSEKERLSNVLAGLFELFHQASAIGNAAKDFIGKIKSCPLSKQRTQIDKLTQDAGRLYQSIFREYREKHQYYNSDISNIIQNDGAFHALLDAMYDYMWTIDRLKDTPKSSAMMVLETLGKQITKSNREVSLWIAEALDVLMLFGAK